MNKMEGTIVFEFPGKENEERRNSVGIELIEIKKRWILDTFLLATDDMNHCVVFMKRKKGELL